jgi:hypothetical protein
MGVQGLDCDQSRTEQCGNRDGEGQVEKLKEKSELMTTTVRVNLLNSRSNESDADPTRKQARIDRWSFPRLSRAASTLFFILTKQ